MTLIETLTTYNVRHYELDEDQIIKDFGKIAQPWQTTAEILA